MQAPKQFQTILISGRALLIPLVVSKKKVGMLITLPACSSPLVNEIIPTRHKILIIEATTHNN